MESLLPKTLHTATTITQNPSRLSATYQQGNVGLVVLPGGFENPETLSAQTMLVNVLIYICLLYTSPSSRVRQTSRMPSPA